MKVAVYTLGCKVNTYESEFVMSLFKSRGFTIVKANSASDIYIINTCTVTNTSDLKSRQIIHRIRHKYPNSIIVVMGCYSQVKAHEIKDYADIILGNKDKSLVVDYVFDYIEHKIPLCHIYELDNIPFEPMKITHFENHTRAFVKIQDGCDSFCSYCIIPYVRGPIRSKDATLVIDEITSLVQNGYQEIVLVGIHTGKYGQDINSSLYKLLNQILNIENLKRVRLSSIEINELTDEVLSLFKNNKLANHLHIPLQAGSDKILKLMNRKYDTAYFKHRIDLIRTIRPDINITTDVIVGFPNESDEDFLDTYNFIKTCQISKVHVFPYSKRDYTVAANMDGEVSPQIISDRTKRLLTLSLDNERLYLNNFIHHKVTVLTEKVIDNIAFGYTSNYLPVKIIGCQETNKMVEVIIDNVIDKTAVSTLH